MSMALRLAIAALLWTSLVTAQAARLTAERLKQLKTTSNDPAGDSFC
jgi:hypothetical protein